MRFWRRGGCRGGGGGGDTIAKRGVAVRWRASVLAGGRGGRGGPGGGGGGGGGGGCGEERGAAGRAAGPWPQGRERKELWL